MFNRIFAELAGKAGEPDAIMIDATHLKAHRTAASLLKGGLFSRRIGRTNLFGRIQDWRRIATRYDRCAHPFMSAISIAATVCYWL